MTDIVQQASGFANWRANDWTELCSILDALLPEFADSPGIPTRMFRGEELSAQHAGTVFERLVLEAFRWSEADVHDPFRVTSQSTSSTQEQIDGLVVLNEWQAFLVESKFWINKVDFGPIALLHQRVQRRPAGTLGMFFSAFGYTAPALESAQYFQPLHVLLFDGKELKLGINRQNLIELVKEKWIAAVKYGYPNYYLVDEDENQGEAQ